MARPREYDENAGRMHGSGRKYAVFKCGEELILTADPTHSYVVGGILPRGQVIETLAMECWASGTRFATIVDGERIEYEVSGRAMVRV